MHLFGPTILSNLQPVSASRDDVVQEGSEDEDQGNLEDSDKRNERGQGARGGSTEEEPMFEKSQDSLESLGSSPLSLSSSESSAGSQSQSEIIDSSQSQIQFPSPLVNFSQFTAPSESSRSATRFSQYAEKRTQETRARATQQKRVFRIEGFVPKHGSSSSIISRSAGDRMFFYVNNRPVDFPALQKLINTYYRSTQLSTCLYFFFSFLLLTPKDHTQQNRGSRS